MKHFTTYTQKRVKGRPVINAATFDLKTSKGRLSKASAFLLLCGVSLATLPEGRAQAPVSVVNGKQVRHQMEREVVTRWNKFDPKWYFLLFHNKYRKGEDRRNMLQLMPTMAALTGNQESSERQEEEVTVMWEQEMFKGADRSLNKSFHLLYGRKIESLNTEMDVLSAEAVSAGVEVDMLLKLREEQERINADIQLTKEAYEDDAVKAKAFRGYLADLLTLRGYYRRIISLFHTADNLSN